ncbi:MAG TPA: pyruvate, water dikinase regulatory protein [Candidatus Acidoferrum sp.]|nr:pyruvate, water dikinase regulatory protein [Candidatus Acidoferrum sp.]
MSRTAFYVSDSTGITAHTLGQSLLAQFEELQIEHVLIPFVDTEAKVDEVIGRINAACDAEGVPALVFSTLVNDDLRARLAQSRGYLVDILGTFLKPLEQVLNVHSSYSVGHARGNITDDSYKNRINAVNYALDNDDGSRVNQYGNADVILVGVSRCGKTPTCLYMALQFGVFAANYPITEEDINELELPKSLLPFKDRLFGLTINAERLCSIRNERRPNSKYASMKQCEFEIREAEAMFRRHHIPYLDTTHFSIEEISTRILSQLGIDRKLK